VIAMLLLQYHFLYNVVCFLSCRS